MTLGYLLLLTTTGCVVFVGLSPTRRDQLLAAISTNVATLPRHPARSLLGSALVAAPDPDIVSDVMLFGVGIVCGLGALEYTYGARWAGSTFLAGHVGATLVTAPIIAWALRDGRYPASVRDALDYGVSYGALAATTAAIPLLRSWPARCVGYLTVYAYPAASAQWSRGMPDFTSIGHFWAASIGLATGWVLVRFAPRRYEHPVRGNLTDRATEPDAETSLEVRSRAADSADMGATDESDSAAPDAARGPNSRRPTGRA